MEVSAKFRDLTTAWVQEETADPDAPILMFLHGFPDTPSIWNRQIAEFKKNYFVLAPYGRGVRKSAPSKRLERYSPSSVTLDHLSLLHHVDPDRKRKVILVGHDIGSAHAWDLARALEGRLHALIILNGVSLDQMARRIKNPRQVARSWYIGLFQVPVLSNWLVDSIGKQVFSAMKQESGASSTPENPSASLMHYRALMRSALMELTRKHSAIEAPVLVLYGKNDPYLEIPTKAELDRIAKNHTIRVINGGHWLQREQPDRVNRLIEEFLNGLAQARKESF